MRRDHALRARPLDRHMVPDAVDAADKPALSLSVGHICNMNVEYLSYQIGSARMRPSYRKLLGRSSTLAAYLFAVVAGLVIIQECLGLIVLPILSCYAWASDNPDLLGFFWWCSPAAIGEIAQRPFGNAPSKSLGILIPSIIISACLFRLSKQLHAGTSDEWGTPIRIGPLRQRVLWWSLRLVAYLFVALAFLEIAGLSVNSFAGAFSKVHYQPFGALGIIVVAMAFAGYLFRLSKQLGARTGDKVLLDEQDAPVLYLRSFKEDYRTRQTDAQDMSLFSTFITEEEQLEQVLRRFGPVVAIGVPGEKLPQLGAARIYVEHSEWKEQVQELMKSSTLVVLRIGATENFLWEYKESLDQVDHERIVLLITSPEEYETFRQLAHQLTTTKSLPAYPEYAMRRRTFPEWLVEGILGNFVTPPPGYRSNRRARWAHRPWSITAVIYFKMNGDSCFVPLKRPTGRRNTIAPALIHAMRPIYNRFGVPWEQAPIAWFRLVRKGLIAVFLFVLIGVLIVAVWHS
jgi:hypothetical protein